MFERDKEDIRRMGIPLQTVVDPAHGDEIGYRIDPSNAAMAPIDLEPAEFAVVALAQEFWSDATVGADDSSGSDEGRLRGRTEAASCVAARGTIRGVERGLRGLGRRDSPQASRDL